MILGIYLLTEMGIYVMFSEHIIICGAGPYDGCLANMANVNYYVF